MSVTLIGANSTTESSINMQIPMFIESISAGFPSPAQDYIESQLDLNDLCIKHPAATFFVRVNGESMLDAGIFPEDILIVDRSIQARHGDIVIASLFGELTVKLLELHPEIRLVPCNRAFSAIHIKAESDLDIFGVVVFTIHNLRKK